MIDIDFEVLRNIGLNQGIANLLYAMPEPPSGSQLARITSVHRDRATLDDGHREHNAATVPGCVPVVGDWALHAGGRITALLPPLSQLARRSADGQRQALASNVDTALLVMGLDHDFNLRRLERYLTLAQGVDVLVVLTKADMDIAVDDKLEQLRRRLPPSINTLAVNATAPETPQLLAPWLGAGQTLILLGSSGAGKSTLTNALAASHQATGGVRLGDGRGRHTTTARSLHRCLGGACVIDTPGLRSWQPDTDEATLAASFDDIEALAGHCQFRDCSHASEPGCAVRCVVDADRLFNYNKLLREVRRAGQTPLDRIAERNKWKVLMKAVGARDRAKRGG
ncbi:MAG: ribosome small subunit-dependent GTPase A [Pseudomonadota bacterium]